MTAIAKMAVIIGRARPGRRRMCRGGRPRGRALRTAAKVTPPGAPARQDKQGDFR